MCVCRDLCACCVAVAIGRYIVGVSASCLYEVVLKPCWELGVPNVQWQCEQYVMRNVPKPYVHMSEREREQWMGVSFVAAYS